MHRRPAAGIIDEVVTEQHPKQLIMDDINDTQDDLATGESAAATAPEPSELQRQRDEYYDLLLRKTAEFDNYRKRIERERQSFAEATTGNVLEDLLPLLDDLERALAADAGTEGAEAYRRGVELIYSRLQDLLRKRGVRQIEALGEQFDPHVHQAVSYEPAEGRPEGEVIEDFRRGYMLGDRLLRPSMVKVAKG
jgi:molecular chaperone GrpE